MGASELGGRQSRMAQEVFRIACACGNEIEVKSSQAGDSLICACGKDLLVPSLSTLRSHGTDGAVPADSPESPDEEVELPSDFIIHIVGDVGPQGRICSTAIANYVSIVDRIVDEAVSDYGEQVDLQLMAACAILPDGDVLIEVDAGPGEHGELALELHTAIAQVPRPHVIEGPVAVGFFRQLGSTPAEANSVQPFRRALEGVEADSLDDALMWVAGLDPRDFVRKSQKRERRGWLYRLGRFLSRNRRRKSQSPEETYAELKSWYYATVERAADAPIEFLEQCIAEDPDQVAYRAMLAHRYGELEQWQDCVDAYDDVIDLLPNFGLLYGLRGQVHQIQSNCQEALADFEMAIALAPFDAAFFYQRSQIYVELQAWNEAAQDLIQAHHLAPRDTSFLLAGAGVLMEVGHRELAREYLHFVINLDPNSGHAYRLLGWLCHEDDTTSSNLTVEHFTRAIELLRDDVESYVGRSMAYALQNKFALALADCDTATGIEPEFAGAHAVRGRVLYHQGDFEDAIEACSNAIDLGDPTPLVLLVRGMSYLATEQPELAAADCESVLEMEPDNALALNLKGNLDLQDGELDAAMEAFRRASKLSPEWTEPRSQIALLHRIREDPQAAVEEQSKLVESEPQNHAHYVNRAMAYVELGKFDEARDDFDRAHDLDPENEEIIFLRGNFFQRREDYERALEDFNRVLEIASDHDGARFMRANVLLQLQRQEEALEDYSQLIAKYPDDPQAYMGRAYTLTRLGDESAAEDDFKRLMDIVPEDSESVTLTTLLARLVRLRADENYDEAFEVAAEIIELAPDQPIGYRLRGGIYWDREEFVEADEDFTRAIEYDEDVPELLSMRGQVRAEQGEWRPALDDLDEAIEISRKRGSRLTLAYALSGRSLAFAGLNRMDESIRDYEESVQLCPENPWVYFHRGMVMFHKKQFEEAERLLEQALTLSDPPLSTRKRARAVAVQQQAHERA